jgi:uncharacterized membrane protein YbaN (DUF454 family)
MSTHSNEQHDKSQTSRTDCSAILAGQSDAALNSGLILEGSTLGTGMRRLLIVLGSLFVCLGIIGIILPLVPTTPFLLLAAACYARSSEKYYNWLLNHRWFGEYLRNYQAGKGIPVRVKLTMLVFLWTSIGLSAAFIIDIPWVRIMLIAIATAVSVHMYYLPTFRPAK